MNNRAFDSSLYNLVETRKKIIWTIRHSILLLCKYDQVGRQTYLKIALYFPSHKNPVESASTIPISPPFSHPSNPIHNPTLSYRCVSDETRTKQNLDNSQVTSGYLCCWNECGFKGYFTILALLHVRFSGLVRPYHALEPYLEI